MLATSYGLLLGYRDISSLLPLPSSSPRSFAYLHQADAHEWDYGGISQKSKGADWLFLGLGVPPFRSQQEYSGPSKPTLSLSAVVTAASTTVAAVTNPK